MKIHNLASEYKNPKQITYATAMINILFSQGNKKKEWCIPYIEQSIKELDINLSLYDGTKMWNIYKEYGKGFCVTGPNESDGYEYTKSLDFDFAIVECVHNYKWFLPHKKDWFIFRLGGFSGVTYPKLMSYRDINHWNSEGNTYEEVLEIAKKMVKATYAFYNKQEQEDREQMAQEQDWEDMEQMGCSPHGYCSEEKGFNDIMDDMGAWGNID